MDNHIEPAMTLLIRWSGLCFVAGRMSLIMSSAAAQEPKRLQALDRRRSKEDKELRDKLQPFARLFSAAEFEKIYQGFVGMVSSRAFPHSSRQAGMVCSPDSVRWRWLTAVPRMQRLPRRLIERVFFFSAAENRLRARIRQLQHYRSQGITVCQLPAEHCCSLRASLQDTIRSSC
jgi:hypothetical protein